MLKIFLLVVAVFCGQVFASDQTDLAAKDFEPTSAYQVQLHFFWATGFPYDLVDNSDSACKTVHLGGKPEIADLFKRRLRDELLQKKGGVSAVIVLDRLTRESNTDLDSIHGLQVVLLEDIMNSFDSVLHPFMSQAFCGNPAVASDVYRLVAMPFANGREAFDPGNTFVYCDVDTFALGDENTIECVLSPEIGDSVFKTPVNNNDIVKLKFTSYDCVEDHNRCVITKLLAPNPKSVQIHIFPNLVSDIRTNRAEAVLQKSSDYHEPQVIDISGPRFLHSVFPEVNILLPCRKNVSAMAWNSLCPLILSVDWHVEFPGMGKLNGEPLHLHIDGRDHRVYDAHVCMLRLALKIFRIGREHPVNAALLSAISAHNPYNQEKFLQYFSQRVTTVIAYDKIIEMEKIDAEEGLQLLYKTSYFYLFRQLHSKLGIPFEWPKRPSSSVTDADVQSQ